MEGDCYFRIHSKIIHDNNKYLLEIRGMDTGEIIALVIALNGSILTTFLGMREFHKERRQIKVILEYIYYFEVGQITITNTGHRPITITGIGMER